MNIFLAGILCQDPQGCPEHPALHLYWKYSFQIEMEKNLLGQAAGNYVKHVLEQKDGSG